MTAAKQNPGAMFPGCACAALFDSPPGATAAGRENQAAAPPGRPAANGFQWPDSETAVSPRDDGRVAHRPLLNELGLDGLIDAHSHWFPDPVMRKIWRYFDQHYWPITYRQLTEGRLEWVRHNRIKRFTTLNYAHRPLMAEWLNEWTAEFARKTPEAIAMGTFFHEPGVERVVRRCIEEYRFKGFKLHLRVSDMDPTHRTLAPAFEQVEAAGLPVILHAGSAPDPGRFTAPRFIRGLLDAFPRLKVVVAHMGAWDWEEYISLAEQRETLYLDTTMVFVGFQAVDPMPAAMFPRLEAIAAKILFGTDFPNIPYPISHAVEGIGRLPLSKQAKRSILYDNAVRLFGLDEEDPIAAK